ncbi:hypothetical protein B0H14DRAFT_512333 [Mycena olivaceomarginata]|nr:hypothetical protein B0H14DRAFT_512333 [Mycena olivaceomarginata]
MSATSRLWLEHDRDAATSGAPAHFDFCYIICGGRRPTQNYHGEVVYMRQQRRSQPWMRSIVGLVITTRIIGVLRADTLGIEQCTFDRDCSRGVLDSIRICLGLVRATSLQRGQHEDFELADTKTLAPGHLKSKKGQDVFAPEASAVEYNHRTVRFI